MLPYQHSTLEALPAGDAGVELTLRRMRRHVEAAKTDPGIRAAVLEALRGVREKDELAEVQSLFEWVLERTRFTRDPRGVELLQEPPYLLRQIRREGIAYTDCDDASMLFAALAETAGYRTRFRVQGGPGRPYSHVLVDVLLNGRWVSFDASQRRRGPGWRPGAGVAREAVEGTMARWYQNGMPEPEIQWEPEALGQVLPPGLRRRVPPGIPRFVGKPVPPGYPEIRISPIERPYPGHFPPGLLKRMPPWFRQRYAASREAEVVPPEARGDLPRRWTGFRAELLERLHRPGLHQVLSPPMEYEEEGLGQETQAAAPSGWLAQVTGAVTQVAESAIPLLERYGVLRPQVRTPTGQVVYTAPLPVSKTAAGAAFTAATTPIAFGLTGTQILLLGGGALALLLFLPRGR